MNFPIVRSSSLLSEMNIPDAAHLPIPVCSRLIPRISRWKAMRAVWGGRLDAPSRSVIDVCVPLTFLLAPPAFCVGGAILHPGVLGLPAMLAYSALFAAIGLRLYFHDCRRAVAIMAVRQALVSFSPEDLHRLLATREVDGCKDTQRAIYSLLPSSSPVLPVLPELAQVFAVLPESNSATSAGELL